MAKKKKKEKKSKKKGKSRNKRRRYDSKKLQDRLKRSQERAGGGMKSVVKGDADVTLYRPGDGAHIIDVIPYEAGKNDPLVDEGEPTYTLEIWVHPQLGPDKQVRLCMERMYNKPCAVCDHRQQLRDKGKDEEVWKKLFPKCRHLYNVVSYDKGEEKKGVQVWDVSYHYSEKHIVPLSKRPTRGGKERTVNFADADDGKSITFSIEPAKSKNDYPDYIGWAFEDRDYEVEDEILDAAHSLDEIIHIPSKREVSELYWGKDSGKSGGGRDSDDDDDDDDDDESLSDLLEEVEDMDDMDDLEDFIDEHDLDVKVKRKDDEDDVKEKIVVALEEKHGDGDDDEDDDDDEPEYSKKEIRKMKKKKLKKLIKEEDLDVDPDDAEDLEELQDMVIEELYD